MAVACATFLFAHILHHRYRYLLWLDAIGLALFAVTGASNALMQGTGSVIAVAMGVTSATFGGIIRDILGGESPIILRQEIYITAAFVGASVFVMLVTINLSQDIAVLIGFIAALALRFSGLYWGLTLPRYRPKVGFKQD